MKIDLRAAIPGGILKTDFVHITENDGTCSRCRRELDDGEVPLMLWLPPTREDMLIYCEACISGQAHADLATTALEISD